MIILYRYKRILYITVYFITCNYATCRIDRENFFFVIIHSSDTEYVMRINLQMMKHTKHTIVLFNLRYIIFNQNPGVIDVYLHKECLRRPPLELRSPWHFSLFRLCAVRYYVCWRQWRPCNFHHNINKQIICCENTNQRYIQDMYTSWHITKYFEKITKLASFKVSIVYYIV